MVNVETMASSITAKRTTLCSFVYEKRRIQFFAFGGVAPSALSFLNLRAWLLFMASPKRRLNQMTRSWKTPRGQMTEQ